MKKGILESQKLKGCRRVMALVLASAMIFSSSGVQTMAQEEAIEAAAEAQAAAEAEAARQAAEAQAAVEAEAARQAAEAQAAAEAEAARQAAEAQAAADAQAARQAAEAQAAADAEAARQAAEAQAAADAEAARQAAETQAAADAEAARQAAEAQAAENRESGTENTESSGSKETNEQVNDGRLVLKLKAAGTSEDGYAKLKAEYTLSQESQFASVDARIYVNNENAAYPQFDNQGNYTDPASGRHFVLWKDENGATYIGYTLKPGESFQQEFLVADLSVAAGESSSFTARIYAIGAIPKNSTVQESEVSLSYAVPAEETVGDENSEAGEETAGETSEEEGAEPEEETPSEEGAEPEEETPSEEGTEPEEETPSEEGSGPEEETPSEEGTESEDVPEEEETDVVYGTEFSYSDGNVMVTAVASPEAKIPANAELRADAIPAESAVFENAVNQAESQLGTPENYVAEYVFYDIYFMVDGQKIEPEDGTVSVTIEFVTPIFAESKEVAEDYSAIHITESNDVEVVTDSVSVNENGAVEALGFTTDSFSPFGVRRLLADPEAVPYAGDETPLSINDNCTFSYSIKINDKNYYGTPVERGSKVTVEVKYAFDDTGVKPKPWVKYDKGTNEITESGNLRWIYDIQDVSNIFANAGIAMSDLESSGTILDKDNKSAGTYTVNGTQVTFEYDPEWVRTHSNNISGTFRISGTIDEKQTEDDGEIRLPLGDYGITIKLENGDLKLEKSYTVDTDGNLVFTIVIKAEKTVLKNIAITDTMTGDLQFIWNSFTAQDSKGAPVALEIQQTEDNPQKIIIKLPETFDNNVPFNPIEPGNDVTITYKVNPKKADGTVGQGTNTATGTGTGPGTGEGTGTGTGEIDVNPSEDYTLTKSGEPLENNILKYTIKVNELGQKLNNGDPLTLTDWLDKDKVLYNFGTASIVDKNGKPVEDASIQYRDGVLIFTLPDEMAITVSYTVTVLGDSNTTVSVTNKAELTGGWDAETTDEVFIKSSTATITGESGTVRLTKIGAYSISTETGTAIPRLQGAVFELHDGIDDHLVETATTDESGSLTFGETKHLDLNHLYYFIEIEAPKAGVGNNPRDYILDGTRRYFYINVFGLNDAEKATAERLINEGYTVVPVSDGGSLEPINNYRVPDPVEIPLKAIKWLDGAATDTTFSFLRKFVGYEPKTTGSNPKPYVPEEGYNIESEYPEYSKENGADGTIDFGTLKFKYEGTYTFAIEETAKEGNYFFDGRKYNIVFTVERSSTHGNLVISSVKVNNRDMGETRDLEKLAEQIKDNVVFKNATKTGFSLTKNTKTSVSKDEVFTFDVSIADITSSINFDWNSVTWTNAKSVVKQDNSTVRVQLELAVGTQAKTVSCDGIPAGSKITVQEIDLPNGWTIVENESALEISKAAINKNSNVLTVTNEYSAEGSWKPSAKKAFNRPYKNNETFTYEISETTEDSKPIAYGTSGADGIVHFVADGNSSNEEFRKKYTEEGTYTYFIKETKETDSTIIYDEAVYKVVVTVTDNDHDGNLYVTEARYKKEKASGEYAEYHGEVAFQNTYTGTIEWAPTATKTLEKIDRDGETFTFNLYEGDYTQRDVSGVKPVRTGTNKAGSAVTFDDRITYNTSDLKLVDEKGDSVKNTYIYTLMENAGSHAHMKYDDTRYKIKVQVFYNQQSGSLEITETYEKYVNGEKVPENPTGAGFVNKYEGSTAWTPEANKVLTGRDITEGEFTYTVIETNENWQELENGNSTAGYVKAGTEGNDTEIVFDSISYDQKDLGTNGESVTYYYVIKEDKAGTTENGVTYDSAIYKVKVSVGKDTNGNLAATPEYLEITDTVPTFENSYAASGDWSPNVTKTLTGRDFNADEKFTFEIREGNNVVATGTAAANGKVTFDPEKIAYTTDASKIDTDNPDLAKRVYSVGEHTYTIHEVRPKDEDNQEVTQKDGITYPADQTVTVTVADKDTNKDGVLIVNASDEGTPSEFVNAYHSDAFWVPNVAKTLTGRDFNSGEEFTFEVREGDAVVATGTTTGTSKATEEGCEKAVTFTPEQITYTTDEEQVDHTNGVYLASEDESETHTYTIHEVRPTDESGTEVEQKDGITYPADQTVKVTTSYDKQTGKLTVTADDTGKPSVFVNQYEAKKEWAPEVTKTLVGRDFLVGESFTFQVRHQGTNEIVSTGTVTGGKDGIPKAIEFTDIVYTQKDIGKTYIYEITEEIGGGYLQYSKTVISAAVQITDAGNGKLDVTATYSTEDVNFTNIYNARGSWIPEAEKVFDGEYNGRRFYYDVVEGEGDACKVVSTGYNTADGKITFMPIYYLENEAGRHTYIIKEVAFPESGIAYDTAEFKVVVDVADDGSGMLIPTVVEEESQTAKFENKVIKFNVNKVELGSGKEVAGAELTVLDKDGRVVDKWISEEGKTHDFGDKLKAGESYTLKETVAPEGYAYTTDIEFTVKADGTIETTANTTKDEDGNVTYLVEDAKLHFNVNKVELGNGKEVAGAELTVLDKDGKVVDKWVSEEGKTHDFGDKLKAGESYTLKETVAPEGYAYTTDIAFTVGEDGKITTDAKTTTDADGNVTYLVEDAKLHFNVNKVDLGSGEEVAGAELTVVDKDGNVIDSWVSEAGKLHDFGDKLKAGESYTLKETVAPKEYAYTKDIAFTVGKDGTITAAANTTTDANGNIVYLVEDAKLHFYVDKVELGSGKEIAGAELALLDKEGNLIDKWVSEEGKTHDVGDKLEAGESYTLRETVAPDGYVYTTDIEFTVEKDGTITTTANTTKDEHGNVTCLVEDAKLHFNVNKVELGNGKEVAGAELTVLDKDGNVVDKWVSEEGKTHDFGDKLKAGESYTLKETVAPEGYAYTTDIEFTVGEDGKITTDAKTTTDADGNVTYLAEDAKLHFNVNKVELGSGKEVAGAELTVFDKEGNVIDKWISEEGKTHDFGDKLKAGESYTLKETAAPKGYAYTTDIAFKVNTDGTS